MHFLEKSPADLATTNAALSACANSGKWQSCCEIFKEFKHKALRADVFSYSICINGFEKSSQWERAIDTLQKMLQQKVEPNEVSFNAAISSCKSPAAFNVAKQLFNDMDQLKIQRSIVTFNAVLHVCEKGMWEEAIYIMQELEKSKLLQPKNESRDQKQQRLLQESFTLSGVLSVCQPVWSIALHFLNAYIAKGGVPNGLHVPQIKFQLYVFTFFIDKPNRSKVLLNGSF